MKTIITASAMILASNVAVAGSFEEWQTDGNYNPVTLTEPTPSSGAVAVSLNAFSRENRGYSTRLRSDERRSGSDEGFASSLDQMNEENPDHV